jgi:WD40 repeat protein
VICVAWSPDGMTLVSGSGDRTVRFWNVATRQWFRTLRSYTDIVHSLAWSPDGQMLASVSGDNVIRIHEAATGTLLLSLNAWGTTVETATSRKSRQEVYRVMPQPATPTTQLGISWSPSAGDCMP